MKIFRNIQDWQNFRKNECPQNLKIGFVPTMGALHNGHLSLLKCARSECEAVVLSIFINPTQFNSYEDLEAYPQNIMQDLHQAEFVKTDFVLLPERSQMYPDQYRYQIHETTLSQELCGAFRPGHFDGVLTVVLKLLNIVGPCRAYFGEKDFQQLQLVKEMCQAFFLPVEIKSCPTVREDDGLAMSSRNTRLSETARKKAPQFAQILASALPLNEMREELEKRGFKVEYITQKYHRVFGAVELEGVRLIDNVITH